MGFSIDPPTMFLALVASTTAAVILLLWCFLLNRSERSPLWTAFGFFLAAVATFLIAARGQVPGWLSIDVGVSLLLFGTTMPWAAARVFNRRPVAVWILLIGPVAWLVACRVPAFYADFDARVIASAVISTVYYLAAAREFFARDGLLNRLALSTVLVVQSAVILLRIPLTLIDPSPPTSTFSVGWFGPVALEAAIFIQVMAFLMVSLIKERVEMRLRTAALTDPLTGLGNRRAFFDRCESAIAHNRRHVRPLAVVLFDLDRFKEINDRHGHPIGDLVIQTFAISAMKRLRAGDFVARLGGEEFAVMMPDTTAVRARLVAESLGEAFTAAVAALERPGLRCTTSAGIAELSAKTESVDELLLAADRALYEAKDLGGARVRLGGILPLDPEARSASAAA